MSEQTALRSIQAIDRDRYTVQRSVIEIMHILDEYIPHACRREASDKLFDAFFINGVELTTNTMRKEYEEWKKLNIESMMTAPPKSFF